MGILIFWIIFCFLGIFIALLLLKRIYGEDIKKWEPIIFTKNLTIGSSLFLKKKEKNSILLKKENDVHRDEDRG